MYEFFDDDVVLACAAAGVFVSFTGFVGVCGAVNSLSAGQVNGFHDNWERELCNRGLEIGGTSNNERARCRDAEPSRKCTVFVLVVDLEACSVAIVAGESQLFANVHGRKQSEIVATGTNRLNALALGEFQHGVFVAKVCKNVLVGVGVAQTFAGITRGNHVPAEFVCGLD